jgi:hypothetical protein
METETIEQIRAERDLLMWLYDSLDERLVISPVNGTRRKHSDVIHYVKSRVFDVRFGLEEIRNRNTTLAD